MSVTVIGMDYDNSDGLQVSLAAHAKAHRENGDMMLNLNDAAKARAAGLPGPKKTDPRPKYNPEDHPFPKAIYHADGRVKEVANVAQINRTRQLDTAGGASFWTNLGKGQPETLLGAPIYESTTMDPASPPTSARKRCGHSTAWTKGAICRAAGWD